MNINTSHFGKSHTHTQVHTSESECVCGEQREDEVAKIMLLRPPSSLLRPSSPLRSRGISASAVDVSYLPTPTSVLLSLVAFSVYKADELRARGWLEMSVNLRVGPSRVPGAGRGVFAASDIAASTVLGAYPGRVLSPAAYYSKVQRVPNAADYCFVLEDSRGALDPTDDTGTLCEPLPLLPAPLPEFSFGAIDTTLALINEPPPSADVNVLTAQRGSELVFSTARDIYEGEELYLDYGPLYDRSRYTGAD